VSELGRWGEFVEERAHGAFFGDREDEVEDRLLLGGVGQRADVDRVEAGAAVERLDRRPRLLVAAPEIAGWGGRSGDLIVAPIAVLPARPAPMIPLPIVAIFIFSSFHV
jgi:hypothetical protein